MGDGGPWPLIGILVVQALLSLRLVWSNSAFNDEALYLWTGHWEIAHLIYGTAIPGFQTYFSGAPVIYPVVAAVVDSYGGLAAARLLSLAFMLGASLLLYLTTARLFTRRAGLIAAASFAVLGPVQFLGAFATYDAMALFLLVASAWLVTCARSWWSEPALIVAALVLVMANATKYPSALWDPVVVAMVGLTASRASTVLAGIRAARFAGYVALVLAVLLYVGGHSYLQGILFTTLSRASGRVPALTILRESALWVGIVFLIALRGVVIAPNTRTRLLCAVLALAGILAPLEQARIHTGASIEKHVAFGIWFSAVAAGYVLDRAVTTSNYARLRIAWGTIAALLVFGVVAADNFYASWPNTGRAVAAIGRVMHGSRGPILTEQKAAVDYYLHLSPPVAIGPDGFYWWDRTLGRELTGADAYVQAIRAHYFAVVEVDGTFSVNHFRDSLIEHAVETTPGYKLVAVVPWTARVAWASSGSRGFFKIWRYEGEKH